MPKIRSEIKDWFNYPDDPYQGRVLIRLPKVGEQEAIKERAREVVLREFRQEENQIVVRAAGARESLAMAAVLEWENFFDADDQPLACTPANVRLMCREAGFLEFVDTGLAELEARLAKQKKAESKN